MEKNGIRKYEKEINIPARDFDFCGAAGIIMRSVILPYRLLNFSSGYATAYDINLN